MPTALAVALGGALGATTRYGLDRFIERRAFSVFPWSTFLINISGCLVIGLVTATLIDRPGTPAWLRIGLVMGVIGGYTTFSTYAQETLDLLDDGRWPVAVAYAGGSVLLGLAAVVAGMRLGRLL